MTRTAINGAFAKFGWSFRIEANRWVCATPRVLIRLIPIVAWTAASLFLGVFVGLAAVVLPATGVFGIVGVVGLVLLWAMPDLPAPPTRMLPAIFFIVLLCFICVPNYYAFQVPGLPWISIRRLFLFVMIVPFALALSGSSTLRSILQRKLVNSRPISACLLGFIAWSAIVTFTGVDFTPSLSALINDILTWYLPFLVLILILDSLAKIKKLLYTICCLSLFVALMGIVEFYVQRRFYVDLMPTAYRDALMEANPAFAALVTSSPFRNGYYRASSIFGVPLPFGEFEAMVMPFGLYCVVHARSVMSRVLGVVVIVFVLLGIFTSGARGGYISMMAATAAFVLIWIVRYARQNPGSLVPASAVGLFGCFSAVLGVLIVTWGRLHNMILGGGQEAFSTDARWAQWALLKAKLIQNPIRIIVGHGRAMGGEVIAYYSPGAQIPSVDSYILTLLCDTGIPGLFMFFGAIVLGVFSGVRRYIFDPSEAGPLAGALACSLLAFGTYRITLSQEENNFLFFVVIAAVIALNDLKVVQ